MPAPVEYQITTFPDFVSAISTRLDGNRSPIWFRGCGDAVNHSLTPSLYRHAPRTALLDVREMELESMALFKQRSVPFRSLVPNERSWDQLFIMQHYGVPSRLLDWSESPFAALFFALTSAPRDAAGNHSSTAVAIWMLDPAEWNKHSLRDVGGKADILSFDSPDAKSYEPITDSTRAWGLEPIALFGTYNSPRIVAQRGTFTIAGTELAGMERLFDSKTYPAETLQRLVIPSANIGPILSTLVRIGNVDSVFFPDLDGLAREIRRRLGFRV